MKIASWNVNSIRVRHDQVCQWVKLAKPDVLCMQETKVVDDDFPTDEFQLLGYGVAMAGQAGYNGVAIASRLPMKDIRVGLYDHLLEDDKRLISATIGGIRIFSAYVPNGKSLNSPSFREKLRWYERLRITLDTTTTPDQDVLVCGDFNVAADERDVFDAELMRGKIHFHPEEHKALARLKEFGLTDAYRLFHKEGGHYSWWDYRAGGFRRNEGLRIDYVFLTESLTKRCRKAWMDVEPRRLDKPSDHIPVIVEID